MIEDIQFAHYRLLGLKKVKQKLLQIFDYWPAVILVVGGTIVTLGWTPALAWLTLRLLHVV